MLAERLMWLGFTPRVDFIVQNDSDGRSEYIARWLAAEPRPTPDEIAAATKPASITIDEARNLRAAAYRDELGVDTGDFIKTIGDVLDTIITEIATLRASQPTTVAFTTLITRVQAIKARFPKE